MSATHQFAAGATLQEFMDLPEQSKALVRNQWIARAFYALPGLTAEEKRLAHDKELASECALWRSRFKQTSEDLAKQKQIAQEFQARLDEIQSSWMASLSQAETAEELSRVAEELEHERKRSAMLETHLGSLTYRVNRILAGLVSNNAPESTGVANVA